MPSHTHTHTRTHPPSFTRLERASVCADTEHPRLHAMRHFTESCCSCSRQNYSCSLFELQTIQRCSRIRVCSIFPTVSSVIWEGDLICSRYKTICHFAALPTINETINYYIFEQLLINWDRVSIH